MKIIQSDRGGEYINRNFDEFLKRRGITRRLIVPHNPEQNGTAERKNRTLVEMARCLLIESGLPKIFWAEAVNMSNYLRNRSPTASLGGKTPFEAWTGEAPDLSELRVFGSRVVYLDRDPTRGKFDQRGLDGIFLGFSEESKGYRIWSSEKKKVIVRRDVKFVEEVKQDISDVKRTDKTPSPADESGDINRSVDVEFDPCDQGTAPSSDDMGLDRSREDFLGFDNPTAPSPQVDSEVDVFDDAEDGTIDENEVITHTPRARKSDVTSTNAPKRGPGRPTVMRTGKRGRPKKLFRPSASEEADFARTRIVPRTRKSSEVEWC